MTSMATDEDLGTRIEEVLRRRFSERSTAAEAYGTEFAALWREAADHALGGKLIRPRLLLDFHRALSPGGVSASETTTVIDIAAHVELLHYAFLLHDDVIDGDLIRRRRPNLIGSLAERRRDEREESALHWARSSAILMGDLLLASSVLGFARADVSSETRVRLLALMEQTIFETVAGEHIDVGLTDGIIAPDLRTILSMSAYKTATYSFVLPLRAAAVLAGASSAAEEQLTEIGRHLGLAYQLQDDLLSVFGDSRAHGKDAFSDLREGKETAIIAYARMTGHWPSIELHFGSLDLSVKNATGIRERLRECGAESFARSLVEEQLVAVSSVLAEAEEAGTISAEAGRTILGLATRIESRRA